MQRYSNIEFLYNLEFEIAIDLIIKAYEETEKEKLFKLYVNIYPYMTEENFMSFEEYYSECLRNSNQSKKTAQEIIEEVKTMYENAIWGEVE